MPKNKGLRYSIFSRSQDYPFFSAKSMANRLQSGASTLEENAQVLHYYALLAEARAGVDEAVEHQPQQSAGSKGHRGGGYTLKYRMELVEIFRYLRSIPTMKITANNFGDFMHVPIKRQSIKQWDKDFDRIQFDVAYGRGNKCTLSSSPVDLIRHVMDRTVHEWLLEVRKSNGIINGLQLQAAADSVVHILTDDIRDADDIPPGRTISFTASWRSTMTQEYGVVYCSFKGEARSVDKNAIAERMGKIREICSGFELDDIYTCDETGLYLRELSTHSDTTEESAGSAKPERGATSRVSVLFCVNASGSSLARAATVEALRPLAIGPYLVQGIQPCPEVPITSTEHGKGHMTLDLFKGWLHSLDDSLSNESLLLINSWEAHGKSSDKDPLAGETWKHLRIERLPPDSASVTQPLDAGIISVFKRHYLEMLSNNSITREYATGKKITNGEVWSLIPYAWSHVKALTVRHCFCKAGVLSEAQADTMEEESMYVEERPPLYPNVANTDASQVKRRYVRLIASFVDGDKIQFSLDEIQKDAQDMAEEAKQMALNEIAQRDGSRERSSSIESEVVELFRSRFGGESLVPVVLKMLENEDATNRWAAREVIRKFKQE